MQKWVASVVGLTVVFCSSVAQAAVVTYDFTASISGIYDAGGAFGDLGFGPGQGVTGQLSYDTDAPSTGASAHFNWGGASLDIAYEDYSTGSVTTSELQGSGGGVSQDAIVYAYDYEVALCAWAGCPTYSQSGSLLGITSIQAGGVVEHDGQSVAVTYLSEEVYLLQEGSSSLSLPSSLELNTFSLAQYSVTVGTAGGGYSTAWGQITSLTRAGAHEAVPELTASGAASSMGLLAAGALVLTGRRREV